MRNLVRLLIVVLLAVDGLTATYGGLCLMWFPDGSALGLPRDLLEQTPFRDYFLPGLILLLSNGISSLVIAWVFLRQSRYSYWLVNAQGFMLLTYITVQVMSIDVIVPLHIICGGTGLLLILLGSWYEYLLKERRPRRRT